jgi:hypothetical protein
MAARALPTRSFVVFQGIDSLPQGGQLAAQLGDLVTGVGVDFGRPGAFRDSRQVAFRKPQGAGDSGERSCAAPFRLVDLGILDLAKREDRDAGAVGELLLRHVQFRQTGVNGRRYSGPVLAQLTPPNMRN